MMEQILLLGAMQVSSERYRKSSKSRLFYQI